MTARERTTDRVRRSYELVTARDGHMCYVCGKRPGNQLAHRLPQSKLCIARYGEAVIHHPLNLRWVCSLECNKAVEVSYKARPREADALAQHIGELLHAEEDEID